MGLLRRLFGGGSGTDRGVPREDDAVDLDADERAHELEVLRDEQARLDELARRQLRYADYAWQPPAQGGERRADLGDRPES